MKPLQSVAMGLVVVALTARFGGYDALPDPFGWLLVLLGIRQLPAGLPLRGPLLGLATLAGAVSAVLWFPGAGDALYGVDPALSWAADLPQLACGVLLSHALAGRARDADDTRAARWLLTTRTALLVVALLPVLVFGAGAGGLEVASYVAAGAVALLLIWLLFTYAGRPWALPEGADGAGATARPRATDRL